MAVQVNDNGGPVLRFPEVRSTPRPHLRLVENRVHRLPHPPHPPHPPQVLFLRRRRLLRRLRGAASAAGWLAGSVILSMMILGGLAGLR